MSGINKQILGISNYSKKDKKTGLILLSEIEVLSPVASVNFIGVIDDKYDTYVINCVPSLNSATHNVNRLRFSTDGGNSYDSSASYSTAMQEFGTVTYYTSSTSQTETQIAASASAFTEIIITNPSKSTTETTGSFINHRRSIDFLHTQGSFCYNQLKIVNAVQLFNISGNILSGKFKLYGVK